MSNIVSLITETVRDLPPTIILPLDNIEVAREALLKIEASAALGLHVIDQAPEYGDDAALHGVREVFAALSRLLAT